ncbi:MAG: hypothetical protein MUF31_11790 [Akkermansiaceae bacterium]|jgi:RHS repeat-associated protein|nr:hypothetical protein [Akkermansiaceae bacterium]
MDFGQTVNYTANNVNAYTALTDGGYAPPAPSYDARGNTLRLPRRDGGGLTLAWTAMDRLASVNGGTSMKYDALGRLTWVRRPDGQGGNIDEVWSWSGWTLLNRDLLGAGGALLEQFRYTWGPDLSGSLEGAGGVGGLLAVERAAAGSSTWEIRHVHMDANGNVLCLTDGQGQASARYRYDGFGNVLQAQDLDSSGWATRNLHRFSTKPEVAGTGMLYYGYRWYDPVTGRWPSRDPIEESGGMNLYGFVGNDGVNGWDLLGCKPGDPYNTYAEAKAAAVEDLRVAGWASWQRGKDALDKFPDWSEIPPQVQADWAVLPNKGGGARSKHIVAGKEQFTLHYCKLSDGKHYYTSIHQGGFPTAEEREDGKLGGISDLASVQAAFDEIPEDGKLEALGHTHIVQWFRTSFNGNLVQIDPGNPGLSDPDMVLAERLKIEVYVVETDNNVYE